LKSVPKHGNFLSFKNTVDAFSILVTLKRILDFICAPLSGFIETALWETVTLHAMFFFHVFISLSKVLQRQTFFYLLNVTNIIDITSQAHFHIYHRKHIL